MVPSSPYVPCSTGNTTSSAEPATPPAAGTSPPPDGTGGSMTSMPCSGTGASVRCASSSRRRLSGPVSQRPSLVMAIGTTSKRAGSNAPITVAAERSDTSCSPDLPPYTTPTRSRRVMGRFSHCARTLTRWRSSRRDVSRIDRLPVRELDLVPVRIADYAEVADDGTGIHRRDDEDTRLPPRLRGGIDLLARADGEAEMLERRGRRRRIVMDLEQHEHEVGLLGPLTQPHHAHLAVVPNGDHVQPDVAAVELDRPFQIAHPERKVRQHRFHGRCSATRVAITSAMMCRSSGNSKPAAAAWPPPPSASATFDRSTSQSGERRRLTASPVTS